LALENLSSLFLSLVENDDDNKKFLDHDTWIQLDKSVPSLKKFRKLAGQFWLYLWILKSLTGLFGVYFFISLGITEKNCNVTQSCLIWH
jgi:protein transport protein DSL1/ZW10